MHERKYTKNVNVLFTEELHGRLKKYTDKIKIGISKFIRDITNKQLEEIEKNKNE